MIGSNEPHSPTAKNEELCWDTDNGLSLIGCQKPKGHTGDRHGYSNIGGMSAAWGYVDA